MTSKVSFTIRRPTPISRAASSGPDSDHSLIKVFSEDGQLGGPLAKRPTPSLPSRPHSNRDSEDSSDEDSVIEDELVTGFDMFGVQRLNGDRKVSKPLIIPALKNKDWRELARKRRSAAQYVPPSAAAVTGVDGSVGGLGTRDTINSGPVLSGLQLSQQSAPVSLERPVVEETELVNMEVEEETEDQKALKAIIAESTGQSSQNDPLIDIIPTLVTEEVAFKQDVEDLPDVCTIEDYNRVPVSQFGAALLRGMGWKEGTAASRKHGKGLVEPYMPAARPALLGIGAKELEVFDDGSKKTKSSRPERRYVPVVRQERYDGATSRSDSRQRSRSPRRSTTSSKRNSPDRYDSHERRYRSTDPDKRREERKKPYTEREIRDEDRDRRDFRINLEEQDRLLSGRRSAQSRRKRED